MPKSLVIIGILALIAFTIVFAGVASGMYGSFGLNSPTVNNTSPQSPVGGHIPGYPIGKTSGRTMDPIGTDGVSKDSVIDPDKYLREFNYGRVSQLPNGTTLREFTLVASDGIVKEVSPGIFYNVWTFNGTVPGPTIRATQGDIVRVNFINNGSKPHSFHTHGVHPAEMDGVFEMISPGGRYTYQFVAEPFGVFPYHCHMTPLEEHISRGLYGVYIVDPKVPRPPADEMVMLMNGYDTDSDTENNFYTVNGIPYYYMQNPIEIEKNRLVRIYLLNMLEFDPINNFHLHANMFNYYPSGTMLKPDELTDIKTLSQGERGIMEFKYKFTGSYMFHSHKTEFAEKGWMGIFKVNESGNKTQDPFSSPFELRNYSNEINQSAVSYKKDSIQSALTATNKASSVPVSLEKNKSILFEREEFTQ